MNDTILRQICNPEKPSTRLKIVELVCAGQSNAEIAHEVGVAEGTVKFHLTAIFKKLNIKSRSQLISLLLDGKMPTHHQKKEEAVFTPPPASDQFTLPVGLQTIPPI